MEINHPSITLYERLPAVMAKIANQKACRKISTTASIAAPGARTSTPPAVTPWGGRTVAVASTPHLQLPIITTHRQKHQDYGKKN